MSAKPMGVVQLERLVGIPFGEGEATLERADCYGLVQLWHGMLGRDVPDMRAEADLDAALARAIGCWDRVGDSSEDATTIGDVLFGETYPGHSHCAVLVVVPARRILTTSREGGRSYLAPAWSAPWCTAVYRWREGDR